MKPTNKRERTFELQPVEAGQVNPLNYSLRTWLKNPETVGDGEKRQPVFLRKENGGMVWCGFRSVFNGGVSVDGRRHMVQTHLVDFKGYGRREVSLVDLSDLPPPGGFVFRLPLKTREDAVKLFEMGICLDGGGEKIARRLGWSGWGSDAAAWSVAGLVVNMKKGEEFREIPGVVFVEDGEAVEHAADWPDVARMLAETRARMLETVATCEKLRADVATLKSHAAGSARENGEIRGKLRKLEESNRALEMRLAVLEI